MIKYWVIFGIISYFISMIGVYEPYWKKHEGKSPGFWVHLVTLIMCVGLGYIAFVFSLIMLVANFDLWQKK